MLASKARELALALPGAVEAPHHEMTSFRLPGKKPGTTGRIFATMTPDETELRVFIKDDDARDAWIAREPEAVASLFWGARRCGVNVRLARAKPAWVKQLLAESWRDQGGQ